MEMYAEMQYTSWKPSIFENDEALPSQSVVPGQLTAPVLVSSTAPVVAPASVPASVPTTVAPNSTMSKAALARWILSFAILGL